jgi:hypothetical protein
MRGVRDVDGRSRRRHLRKSVLAHLDRGPRNRFAPLVPGELRFRPELLDGANVAMKPEPVRLAKRPLRPRSGAVSPLRALLVNPENTRPRLRWAEHRGMMALAPKTPPSSQAGTAPEIGGIVVCAPCAGSAADRIPRERKEARASL